MQLSGAASMGRSPLPGGFVIPRLFHWRPPMWPVLRRVPSLPSPLTAPIILTRPIISFRQLELVFQPIRLTPLALHVADILRRLARAGDAMPDNPVLGQIAGGHGRSAIYRILGRLEAAGVISMEKEPTRRRIVIRETGHWTDWGPSRPGHAPYSQTPRGAPKPVAIDVIRLGRAARVWVPEDDDGVEVCQYIAGEGRHLASEPDLCGQPVLRGKSWCAGHHALLTKPGRPLVAERLIPGGPHG